MSRFEVVVRTRGQVGPDTVAIELETPSGVTIAPGQFVLIRAIIDGVEHARHYTMSSPDSEETFEITVSVDPDGTLTPWLAERGPGDVIIVEGPFGTVAYEGSGPVRVLAGGPGIGAGLGVCERAIASGHPCGLFAFDERSAHPHQTRLAALAQRAQTVALGSTTDSIHAGAAVLAETVPDGTWFVFGFHSFVETSRTELRSLGVDLETVQIENYG